MEFAQNRVKQTSDAQQQLNEANYGYGLEVKDWLLRHEGALK